ncbi:MAG: hypothetical protein ACK518_01995 [bacterium]
MHSSHFIYLYFFFSKVCDVAKETHASSNETKHSEGEKHKSIFSRALNLTREDKTHLREVYGNMTAEEKAACTPESHTPEEREAWKTTADDQKIVKIQANWAAKTDDKERACALHIHDVRKEHHKKEGKDHKGKGKDQKKEDHGVHH